MVSREYGARKASTHSPNASRPGQVSVDIVSQLVRSGYNLACVNNNEEHSFIEVYPHIAIIEFFGLEERLEYKVSNHRRYWPELSSEESREKVISNLLDLERRLAGRVSSLRNIIPELVADSQRGLSHLKKFEDVMDAIVCALVGTSYIMGEAYPLGDDVGAIWVPRH
jgi:predicted RNase H-like nuclease